MKSISQFLVALSFSSHAVLGSRQPTFNIHDDFLAHPQFQVVFSDSIVREGDVSKLLSLSKRNTEAEQSIHQSSTSSSFVSSSASSGPAPTPSSYISANVYDTLDPVEHVYEVLRIGPTKYLCAIPHLHTPPKEEQLQEELVRAQEKELARASVHGWKLLEDLNGECLYYISGWWSYRFCYNRDIVQFHALPAVPNGQPPMQDTTTAAYILGRLRKSDWERHHEYIQRQEQLQRDRQQRLKKEKLLDGGDVLETEQSNMDIVSKTQPPNSELQTKGDTRYLVQRMGGGTLCDLTGRERTIEVQYHCVPGLQADRIGWIKEITTCSYLMLVNTPRLCHDPAFLPPAEIVANQIQCERIVADDYVDKKLIDQPQSRGQEKEAPAAEEESTKLPTDVDNPQQQFDSHPLPLQPGGLETPNSGQDARQPPPGTEQDLQSQGQVGESDHDRSSKQKQPLVVGGIVVGAKKTLGKEDEKNPVKLDLSKSSFSDDHPSNTNPENVIIIASRTSKKEGGKYSSMPVEQLKELNLANDVVDKMREELEELAGDQGWRLEAIGVPDDTWEIRGFVDLDEQDIEEDSTKKPQEEEIPEAIPFERDEL